MAKNISLLGADYPDVPAVTLPQTGGGTAVFVDESEIIRIASFTKTSDNYGAFQLGASDFPEGVTPKAVLAVYSTSGSTSFTIRGREREFLYVNNNLSIQKNATFTGKVIYVPNS